MAIKTNICREPGWSTGCSICGKCLQISDLKDTIGRPTEETRKENEDGLVQKQQPIVRNDTTKVDVVRLFTEKLTEWHQPWFFISWPVIVWKSYVTGKSDPWDAVTSWSKVFRGVEADVARCYQRKERSNSTVTRRPRVTFLMFVAVMFTSGTSAAGVQVTFSQEYGVLGERAVTRCTYGEWDEPVTLVLWRTENDFNAVYQYAKTGNKTLEGPVQAFQNRNVSGKLHAIAGYHELIINDPKHSDQVGFVCEVFGKIGYGKASGQLKLNELPQQDPEVIYQKQKVNITQTTEDRTKDTRTLIGSISVKKNAPFNLTCLAYRSVPPSNITCDASKYFTLRQRDLQNNSTFIYINVEVNATMEDAVNVTFHVVSPTPKPDSFTTSVVRIQVFRNGNEPLATNCSSRPILVCVIMLSISLSTVSALVVLIVWRRQRESRNKSTHGGMSEDMNTTALMTGSHKQDMIA